MAFAIRPTVTSRRCEHCRSPVPPEAADARFCCAGCEAVAGLLSAQGLCRYYELARDDVAPAPAPTSRSHAWLEPLLARARAHGATLQALELDVQGVHCAACVWLFDETFRRAGGVGCVVNPGLGKVSLRFADGCDVAGWVTSVEQFGYQLGPSRKRAAAGRELPLRLGISAALTINVMLFSVSFYLGLTPDEPQLYRAFSALSTVLSTIVVWVGGWPFFRGAIQAARRGLLHLDLPIALGILLVWSTSLVQTHGVRGDAAYFDTLNTFITLMLVGRWLQQRVLEQNRHYLLDDGGAEGLVARVERLGVVEVAPAASVRAGDVLVLAPGDLVPLDAEALEPGVVSTDWITGEPAPRPLSIGATAPAGAFNAGHTAFRARALGAFADSPLVELLRRPVPRQTGTRFFDALARRWVVQVLIAAGLGLVLWWPHGPARALDVAVSVLVVTCPCAIGIAIPLAYELVQARLRRHGFFARGEGVLDRLAQVRHLVFDKTGTLTLGGLTLAHPEALEALDPTARTTVWNLVARSSHPVSGCLQRALARWRLPLDAGLVVREHQGLGLEARTHGATWRLGRAGWATATGGEGTVLARDGVEVARFDLRETVRADAASELEALAMLGYERWLLSGDAPARVQAFAQRVGVEPTHAEGALLPAAKAARVRALDGPALYLGDGVNDAPAFAAASCAGTPAIERPVMPSRSDFFLLGEGLRSLREALSLSRRLRGVVRTLAWTSAAYNLLAVAACLAGVMTPLRAAVVMPLTSLSLVVATVAALGGRQPATAQPVEETR